MRISERREIERILREAWAPACPEATFRSVANAMMKLLRTGAGEEPLLERLHEVEASTLGLEERSDETLLPVVRDLLRIGVRPRGSCRLRAPEGGERCRLCEREVPFCWRCPCGFRICQDCLNADRWGYTCNNITWECPDCGGFRAF